MKILNLKFKILIPLLFALAVALGILQSSTDNPFIFKKENSNAMVNDDSLLGFYEKSLQLSAQNQNKNEVSFLAVGDIMLSRNVANKIKKAGDPLLPFSAMVDVFAGVNFSVGNLESPFSGSNYIPQTGSLIFNTPDVNIKGLTQNKFKVVSLANNHVLDQGINGLERTINFLNKNGIGHTGAGANLESAWQPAMVNTSGIKTCFVGTSYASINDGGKSTNNYVARIEDTDTLKLQITNLKSNCDFIAVLMHAGTEYVQEPNQSQINFAHAAIDAGADIVIGHHPHWVQTIEKYKGKYIFYSLGNFIFDQMWSQETREGLALKIKISKQGNCHPERPQGVEGSLNLKSISDSSIPVGMTQGICGNNLQGPKVSTRLESIELIPIIIENYSTPRLADEEETKNILNKINIPSTFLPLDGGG